jgi:5'-nucleotidase
MTDFIPAAQLARLRTAIARFLDAFGRVPTVIYDADGVIYDFESTYLAHHNATNPTLPPVAGPFERFDVGFGHTAEVAEALDKSMQTLDWSTLKPYPGALVVIPALLEAGLDLGVATAHRVDNLYSPAAKVFQFHRDFGGSLDNRIQIGIDKTRAVGDYLVDDKPEVEGLLKPLWEHLYFTQRYNEDLPGTHVVWETMVEVLADLIEGQVERATGVAVTTPLADREVAAITSRRAARAGQDLAAVQEETAVTEEVLATEPDPVVEELAGTPAWLTDVPMPGAAPGDESALPPVTPPWETPPAAPLPVSVSWDEILHGGAAK